jgi:hypothetical protein
MSDPEKDLERYIEDEIGRLIEDDQAWPGRDAGAVTNDLVFKALATFVFGGMLYLTYWTAANMWIKEFLLLTLFDIFTFLSWSRTFARGMIHVYDLRPEPTDDDPAEI